jgi:2-phospho-L-lactate guanylyltransferase
LRAGSPGGVRAEAAALRRALCIVVPVRGESHGKSRLAGALDPVQRARLNRRLLRRTLGVVERWQGTLANCIVVSAFPRSLRAARDRGAQALREPSPRRGLNAAAASGLALARRSAARRVLVLPCDLPLLSPAALARLLACARCGARAAIAPDRAGTGTNALVVPAVSGLRFEYGPGSFARHLRMVRARGWEAGVCRLPELSFDLDAPEDLRTMQALRVRGPLREPMV